MCTSIEITAKNGEHFWGRTMDLALPMFGEDPEHDLGARGMITTIPAGAEVGSQLKNGRPSMPQWVLELVGHQFYLMESMNMD